MTRSRQRPFVPATAMIPAVALCLACALTTLALAGDSIEIPAPAGGAAVTAVGPAAAGTPEPAAELWNDPTFQKQFLGSYGVQSEIEPRITPIERQQLEKILPLMGSDPGAAATQLQAVTKPESSAVFDFVLGNLAFQQDQLETAERHYQEALRKFPGFRRAWKNLGLIQVRTGHPKEATTSLTKVVELGGGDALTLGLLGHAYAATGRFTSAESAFRDAIMLQPDVVDWKMGLTQSLLKQQKYAEAASLCEELIGRNPDRTDLWLLQANAFIGLGQPLKAAENFEVVARMGKATVAVLYTLGDIYVNEGLFDPAVLAYRRAIASEPEQSPERALRAVEVLAQRGAATPAKSLVDQINDTWSDRLDPTQKSKLLKVQARMVLAAGDGGASTEILEEIVRLDPLDGEALLLLGQNYARAGDADRSIFYYERAEGIDKVEAEARIRHAQLLVGQSKFADALPLLRRAQEIRPRDDVGRYLEQVERLARSQR